MAYFKSPTRHQANDYQPQATQSLAPWSWQSKSIPQSGSRHS